MLPLLNSRCYLAISASGIALARTSTLRRRIVSQAFIPLPKPIKNSEAVYPLIDAILSQHSSQKSQQLQVLLSSDFVRFMVLPAQQTALTASEKMAFANALYHDVYGTLSDNWLIQTDDTPPQQPTLCAAIDQQLQAQLKAIASQHRFNLCSVVPYPTYIMNRLPLEKYDGFLVIIEPTRLVLAEFNNTLQAMQSIKWEGDWKTPLMHLLNKTTICDGLIQKRLLVYTSVQDSIESIKIDNWQISFLKALPTSLARSVDFQMLVGCV